jgi:hypothetical protein
MKKYTAFELYKKFNTLIIKSFILYKFWYWSFYGKLLWIKRKRIYW